MRSAALKAIRASRIGLRSRACSTATTKARVNAKKGESERANDLQGGAARSAAMLEEKAQQTSAMLHLPLYARDLDAMTINGRTSLVLT